MKITPTSTRWDWSSAQWIEHHVLPVVCAFALGILVMQIAQDRKDQRQDAAELAQARASAQRAINLAQRYAEACDPLLSLPVEAAPMIITTDTRRPPAPRVTPGHAGGGR